MSSTDLERNFSSLVLAAGDSNSLEGDLGTKANLSAAKQPSPARNSAEILTVETSDGELVDFERSIAIKMSPVLREKLESVGPSGVIQLDNITTRAICKVMEYCHVHTAPHLFLMEKWTDLRAWDDKFVQLDPGTLCELASAAYHLGIKPLVDLACHAIAELLKGKTAAEIRRTFNIPNDFNAEEDGPLPTMRDKLRNKLCNSRRKEQKIKAVLPSEPFEDTRSVDELVSFINDGRNKSKSSKKSHHRERKKKLKNSQERESPRVSEESRSQELRTRRQGQERDRAHSQGNNGKIDERMREKRERKEDIIQKIITMQKAIERSECERTTKNWSSSSFSSTSSSPISSSPSSSSCPSSPLSSPFASPMHSRSPSRSSSDFSFLYTDGKELGESQPSAATQIDNQLKQVNMPPNQPNRPPTALSKKALSGANKGLLEISPDDEIWQEEEDDMDPELKAQQDKEVEEFRRRLEQSNNMRPRISLPSTLSLALSRTVDSLKG